MRLGPYQFSLTRARSAPVTKSTSSDFVTQMAPGWMGWWPIIREGFAGAWQRDIVTQPTPDLVTHSTVWACVTLIALDISKLTFRLVTRDANGITTPTNNPAFSPVLTQPNHFQNRMQFIESWVLAKLLRGNVYVLKARDNRNVVTDLYVLDPSRCLPLVTPDGDVYYQLGQDVLAGVTSASNVVPASEIIHDRWNTLYHPLVGLPPLMASALAAQASLKIQHNTVRLFANGASMSGVLTAPGQISTETAKRLEEQWNRNFAGEHNVGKIAVLGDGLKFDKMSMTSVDAQLIDQLNWSDQKVCSTYHLPAYMVGVGDMPNYNNIEALSQQYYAQCLQHHIESIELCLEEGLGTINAQGNYEVEADLESLLRMDTGQQMTVAKDGVMGGILTPNDGRRRFNLKPVPGGDTIYMQQQDVPIETAAKGPTPMPAPTPRPDPSPLPPAPDAKRDWATVMAATLKAMAA